MYFKMSSADEREENLAQTTARYKKTWRQNRFLGFINSAAGALFGAIKGILLGPIWYFIDDYKSSAGNPAYYIIFFSLILLKNIIQGIFSGFLTGALRGYQGGIISDEKKAAPVHDLYKVMTIQKVLKYRRNERSGTLRNYLARKYYGYTPSSNPEDDVLLIQDLLEMDKYKGIIKEIMKKISQDFNAARYLCFEENLKLLPVNDKTLMLYLERNQSDPNVSKFLESFNLKHQQANQALTTLLAAKHAPSPELLASTDPTKKDFLAAHFTLNDPNFDYRCLGQIAGFLGASKPIANDNVENAQDDARNNAPELAP